MKRLRGACIGAGYFSHFHYDAWRRIPEVEIVACCDLNEERRCGVAAEFGLQHHYADYREMLDRERPDFVDIITPPTTHLEMCAEAAQRGVHIICQKPLATNWDDARQLVATAGKTGARLMVHENFRFQPWHREIKRLLDAGAIGDRLHSLAFRTRMGDGWGPNAYLPRQPYFHTQPRLLVHETGVHFIDTFRYLAGEITRVTAWLRRLNPAIQGEDCGLLVFEFAGGAIGLWDANRYNEPNLPPPEARYTFGEFLLEGSAGSIRLYYDGRITVQKLGASEEQIVYAHERRGFAGDCCCFTQRHFVDRLLDGWPFETSGAEHLKTLAVAEAAYRSAVERATVTLPLEQN
jgi:D-apiose dehydrogenase